jgi:NhaP-type Na+/H+ or K+/H+ antiporter
VSLSVAIILFEGGLRLGWAELRSQGRLIVQLITVGALVTWLAASAAAWLVLPLDPWIALLLGSLVVATGPTVIGPLLRRVRIVRRVALVLESEGVLIDPIGAVLAIVVLEVALSGERALVGWPLAISPGSPLVAPWVESSAAPSRRCSAAAGSAKPSWLRG